MKAVI